VAILGGKGMQAVETALDAGAAIQRCQWHKPEDLVPLRSSIFCGHLDPDQQENSD
jgi:hypothetical protein